MRQRLTAVFVAIVTAFVALDVVVLLSLWPQLRRSEELSSQYAVTSRLVATMRGDVHQMRTAATQAHLELRRSAAPDAGPLALARADFEAAARELRSATREYEVTAMEPEEQELWTSFSQHVLPDFVARARSVMREELARTPPGPEELTVLAAAAGKSDRLLQQLAEVNARALTVRGEEIHRTVRTLVLVCIGLGALGIVGGVLLVRWALGVLREHERSTQELDGFAGRVAHDLRNPLQAIGLSLSLIRRRAVDDRVVAASEKAQESVRRMSNFIQELLVFARSGARPQPGASASVCQVLEEVLQDLAPQASERGVELKVRHDGEAHAAIGPEALRAVVGNLADNAVKHMGADRPERVVELSARPAGAEIEIGVRDTGPGIAREVLARVFEPFYSPTDRPGHFGIGLGTVKRLVQAHRGRVEVESEVGRGSFFKVILPTAPPAYPARSASEAARPGARS